MKYLIDLHVHSNVSTHAYSTLEELVNRAKLKGIKGFALTNHGPAMPDAPHEYHFGNLKILPDFIDGVRVYRGIEANILNENGDTDFISIYRNYLEIVLASFHNDTVFGLGDDISRNTNAVINTIKNGNVDILAHMGNPAYKLDYKKVVETATEYGVAIELNNSSFLKSRNGSEKNCLEIIKLCKKNNTFLSLGSDTHISLTIGDFHKIIPLIEKIEYNENLILNSSFEILNNFLRTRRSNI